MQTRVSPSRDPSGRFRFPRDDSWRISLLGLNSVAFIHQREVLALHHLAIGDFDELLHRVVAAGDVAGLVGHVVKRDRAAWAIRGVGVAAVPGEGVLVVNLSLGDGGELYLDRVAFELL